MSPQSPTRVHFTPRCVVQWLTSLCKVSTHWFDDSNTTGAFKHPPSASGDLLKTCMYPIRCTQPWLNSLSLAPPAFDPRRLIDGDITTEGQEESARCCKSEFGGKNRVLSSPSRANHLPPSAASSRFVPLPPFAASPTTLSQPLPDRIWALGQEDACVFWGRRLQELEARTLV